MKKLHLIIIALTAIVGTFASHATTPTIIPQPQTLQSRQGEPFTFAPAEVVTIQAFGADADSLADAVDVMLRSLSTGAGSKLSRGDGGRIAVSKRSMTDDYRLTVTADSILIEAPTAEGAFHALQSLRQLMPVTSPTPASIDAQHIADAPRFGWRGFMLDEARHFFGKEAVKRVIDIMALYKMNRLHWHLTDDQGWRIEILSHPELTEVGAVRPATELGLWDQRVADTEPYGPYYYTRADIREIVDYARRRFVEIVPEVDLPGHTQAAIAAAPQVLACDPDSIHAVWTKGGVSTDVINVGSPKALAYTLDIIDELLELFPYRYIHLGGDECPTDKWETNAQCAAKLKEIGSTDPRDLQLNFYNDILRHIASHPKGSDRRLVLWNEALHGNTNLIDHPEQLTIMAWVDWDKAAAEARRRGMDVVMSPFIPYYINRRSSAALDEPQVAGSGTETLRAVYAYEPVQPKEGTLGLQANFWSEWVGSESLLNYLMLPRLAAVAERSWSTPDVTDFDLFTSRLRQWHTPYYRLRGYNFSPHIDD